MGKKLVQNLDTVKMSPESFESGIDELRKRLLVCGSVTTVISIVYGYFLGKTSLGLVTEPLLRRQINLSIETPGELIIVLLNAAVILGFFTSLPVWAWHLWKFVAPGLTRNERLLFYRTLLYSLYALVAGVFVAVQLLIPLIPTWLYEFRLSGITNDWQLSSYFRFSLRIIILTCFLFHFPLLVFWLGKIEKSEAISRLIVNKPKRSHSLIIRIAISITILFVLPFLSYWLSLSLMGVSILLLVAFTFFGLKRLLWIQWAIKKFREDTLLDSSQEVLRAIRKIQESFEGNSVHEAMAELAQLRAELAQLRSEVVRKSNPTPKPHNVKDLTPPPILIMSDPSATAEQLPVIEIPEKNQQIKSQEAPKNDIYKMMDELSKAMETIDQNTSRRET